MSGLRLGARVLPKELLMEQRRKQVGMEGSSFRLGARILNSHAPKTVAKAQAPKEVRLSVEKIEKAMAKPNAQLVIQLAEDELDDTLGTPRLGALRALLAKAKLPGVRRDIRERLEAAIAEVTLKPAAAAAAV